MATLTAQKSLTKQEIKALGPIGPFLNKPCEQCHEGKYIQTDCFSSWWVKCNDCGHFLFCYIPMDHQLAFHEDQHKVKLWTGGFGKRETSTVPK